MNSAPVASRLLVVTPTLGNSPYLDECVAMTKALNLNAVHVLSCPEAQVRELAGRFPACRVIADQGKSRGMYGAINEALQDQKDQWDWFTYINDDDQLAPGFAQMFSAFTRPERLGEIAYGNVRYIDAEAKSLGLMPTESEPRNFVPLLLSGITPLTQQGILVGSGALRIAGEFDSSLRLVADLDFWVRNMLAGIRFNFYPLEVARFRLHAGQLSGDRRESHAELALVLRHLYKVPCSRGRRLLSKVRYRLRNVPRYVERFTSVGLASTETMLTGKAASRR